jgi:hypothetical protein
MGMVNSHSHHEGGYWNLQQSINMHKENIKHIKAAEKGKPAEELTPTED